MTMKEIQDYINGLSTEELIRVYEQEYLPFKKSGVCPEGIIRTVADKFNKLTGSYEIRFAEQLIIYRMAELFYKNNCPNPVHQLGHNCF